jgi:myo-inositol-1(or 4)-monophosphatase
LIGKGDRGFATDVDLRIESKIKGSLAQATPQIPFLGEEEDGGQELGAARWVLDPIDGTINFAWDSPLCSISLSLVAGRQPVLGIVDAPLLGERLIARHGGGAYVNGARISIAEVAGLREAIVGVADFKVGVGSEDENRVHLAVLARLARESLRVRMLGSAALDLALASGGAVERDADAVEPAVGCDRGLLLVREAGGVVFDYDGSEHSADFRYTIASTPRWWSRSAGSSWRRCEALAASAPPRPRQPSLAAAKEGGRPDRGVRALTALDGNDRDWNGSPRGAPARRLAATLGAEVTLCCALGDEAGRVLRGLIGAGPSTCGRPPRPTASTSTTGAAVSGSRS